MKANKAVLSLALLSGLLLSCSPKRKSLSIFAYAQDDTYILSLFDSLRGDLTNYDCSFFYADRDQNAQNRDIIRQIENGADAVLINLVDRLAASAIVEKAYLSDVPCIFLNRKPLEGDLDPEDADKYGSWVKQNCFYVGSYPSHEGEAQSDIAHAFFSYFGGFDGSRFDKNGDGAIQVCMLKGEQGHQDAEERTLSSLSRLEELGYRVELLYSLSCDWERSVAMEKTSSISLDEVELVLSNNDDMALGLLDHLKSVRQTGRPIYDEFFPIIGVDGTVEGVQAVKDSEMVGTVKNDNAAQSRCAAALIRHLLDGDELPKETEGLLKQDNYYYSEGETIKSPFFSAFSPMAK